MATLTGNTTVVTAPTVSVVTLSEAKTMLRVDHSADDTRITALISAATLFAESYTGLYIMPQTVEWSVDRFPGTEFNLVVWPLASVDSIKYDDTSSPSVEQTLVEDVDYMVDTTTVGGRIFTNSGWPSVSCTPLPIRIRMTAGYPLTGSPLAGNAPESLKEGIMAYVMFLYDNELGMKNAAEQILWHHRVL